MWNIQHTVVNIDIVSGSNQVGTQSANVQVSQSRAPHQLFVTIFGPDFIGQARGKFRPKGLDVIAIGQTALLAQVDEFLLHVLLSR